ncbi:MAG TPA: ABC transporter permease [Spirochaetota bacterium]|nr:ABC transporter permease [Spirochaetota bacterium]HPC42505.1 ABC transporter permease [Spirochaetota bacterium]HPL16077.1 ABC transporter permease [Spirochaetota bacterium]HQF10122.1 ABC transporter permease [Spirochaetota bacterium]HQH98849.1 ABC transporter permease [Spirochaetota bacterium]
MITTTMETAKTFILLGWRNLWRQKRRSLVVILSITIGVVLMLLQIAIMNGMITQMLENNISTKLGHISIAKKGFFDDMKLESNFFPDPSMLDRIRNEKNVVAVAPRVKAFAMIRSSETSRGVIVMGVYPDREKKISKINEYTLAEQGGRYLDDPASNDILISKSLAEKLDVSVGDKIVLLVHDEDSEMTNYGLTVRGLFQTPVRDYDNGVIYMGIKRLQEITGLKDNVSEVMVITTNKNVVDSVKPRIVKSVADDNLEILTWKEMAPFLLSAIAMIDKQMIVFYFIVFITIIFSIANTLIMSIMERFHELGVMKSIGTRPSQIFFIIMFEAMNLGAVGLGVGVLISIAAVNILAIKGIDFSLFMEAMRQWGAGSIIYPLIYARDIVISVVVVEFTTLLAAVYPAVKAARIKPLEALHYI